MSYRYLAVLAWLAWAPTGAAEPLALEVGGLVRRAEIHAPAGGEGPRPLVIALHGLRQPVENLRGKLRLAALAERERFVGAYPHGIEQRWNYGRQLVVAMPLVEGKQVDDIAFFRALIARLVASDRVDPRRIYLLGVSNGALMAYRVACEMGREI